MFNEKYSNDLNFFESERNFKLKKVQYLGPLTI